MYVRAAAAVAATTLAGAAGLLIALTTAGQDSAQGSAASTQWHDGRPLVIAHRGASAYAPENTLEAVDKANALDIDWVENDVQRTLDGELVVLHDTTLARTTDAEQRYPDRAPWNLGDFTAAEIAELDAGGWKDPVFAGARVPTLTRFLERLDDNGQRLLLEIKKPELYPGIEKDILRVLAEEGWLDRAHIRHRLVVQSFSADSLRTLRATHPEVTTGFLADAPTATDLPAYARFADQVNPGKASVTADFLRAAHALKGPHGKPLHVSAWTVNDAETARRLAGLGVDGIITNVPDTIRDAVSGVSDVRG